MGIPQCMCRSRQWFGWEIARKFAHKYSSQEQAAEMQGSRPKAVRYLPCTDFHSWLCRFDKNLVCCMTKLERRLQVHGRRSNNFLKLFSQVIKLFALFFRDLPSAFTRPDTRIATKILQTLNWTSAIIEQITRTENRESSKLRLSCFQFLGNLSF